MDDARFTNKIIRLIFIVFITVFTISGCASTNIPRIGSETYSLAEDEIRMQKRAHEACEIIDSSRQVYSDKRINEYATRLINELLPPHVKKEGLKVSVTVLSDPALNAFALPNGRIYVNTGIIASCENEAQLATLLSHEATHIINRHALIQFRSIINKSAFFSSIQAPAAGFGGDLAAIFAQLAILSSVYGYSQKLENEADKEGFAMVMANGYNIKETVKLFENLESFIKDEEIKQPFFFSTHPKVVARIKAYKELIEESLPQQNTRTEIMNNEYDKIVNPLILDDISFCLQEGMFKTGDKLVNKFLEKNPRSSLAYFYLGELFRQRQDHDKRQKQRDKTEDFVNAIKAYDKAFHCDPPYIEALLAKANILQKQGETEKAKVAFKEYLTLNPDSEKREYIEKFLSTH